MKVNENNQEDSSDATNEFHVVEVQPIFKAQKGNYNNQTHVMVRLLCSKSLPIDLETGIIKQPKD